MVTLIIIAATALLSIPAFNNRDLFNKYLFDPYLVTHKKQQYRIITHAFLHGSWAHLLINMFVLWQFGGTVESSFDSFFDGKGTLFYLVLYFGGIIASSLPTLKKEANNPYYRSIGASGAVSAILFSYILMYPTSMLGFMMVIPIPAIVFGGLYLWYEKRMANQGTNDGIGHDAHYFGAIFGVAATIAFKPALVVNFFQQILSVFV
jgi:membrane associated rhomboid family serine protease